MSGQLIELIIFAAIAFFVINKLIATLGTTSEDNPSNKNSFFGESGTLKDVTNTVGKKSATIIRTNFAKKKSSSLKDLIVAENEKEIQEGLVELLHKMPSFNPINFLKNAAAAFNMILAAGSDDNDEDLTLLVDKRYLENFKSSMSLYGKVSAKKSALTTHISEIYLFGNNVFIKILFTGQNITSKIEDLHEEWTFTKSALSAKPEWQLTNIDRPQ